MATWKYYQVMSSFYLITQKVQDPTPELYHSGSTQLFFLLPILLWAMLDFSWSIFRAIFPLPAPLPPTYVVVPLSLDNSTSSHPLLKPSKFPIPATLLWGKMFKISNTGGKLWCLFYFLILLCRVADSYTRGFNCKVKALAKNYIISILHIYKCVCKLVSSIVIVL